MITIKELTTKRIPGQSSLFISFDYNEHIVALLKECTPCDYNKKTNIWEIPCTRLAKFINGAYKFDEIEFYPQQVKHKDDVIYPLPSFKTNPYEYQLEGIQYGLNHNRWLLLDAPGLGKTLQLIYLAQELKRTRNVEHCLIICGINTLKINWEKEIQKHSELTCTILGKKRTRKGKVYYGGVNDRLSQLKSTINEFFVITNIETLRDDKIVAQLRNGKNKFDMIVVDEIHTCKSNTSQQGKNLLKLKEATYKVGLTGTLLLNNPLDAYVPLKWIGAENACFSNFRYQYCQYGGYFGNEFQHYKNIDVLKEQIAAYSLRRTKDLLELPPKTIIDEYLDMNDSQLKFYDNIVNGVVDQVDKVKITTASLLAMISRLRQATACPSILTTESIPSTKMDRCCELVEEITAGGNKVVVFSTFKKTLDELNERLSDYKPLLCHGDVPDEVISQNIDRFQTNSDNKVMLCTHQKMGTGVTLTSASYAIFIDQPWTSGAYEQACDRIHRIGSKNPVFIYNLICNDTFDIRVHDIVENKEAIGDYIIDNKLNAQLLEVLKQWIKDLQ